MPARTWTVCFLCAGLSVVVFAHGIQVNPQVRYQEWLGIGGSCRSKNPSHDYDRLINDLGISIHRKHLESLKIDGQIEAARQFQAIADANTQRVHHIASIWSPEPFLKLGPYVPNSKEASKDERWCGGTLNPRQVRRFTKIVMRKLLKYRYSGVKLHAFCLQNEPWLAINYASCTYDWDAYRRMFRHAAPRIKKLFPEVKIIAAEMAFAIGGDHNLFAKFLAADPECRPHIDAFAYHGKFPGFRWRSTDGDDEYDPRPGGVMSQAYIERYQYTQPDVVGFIPHWQTECNNIGSSSTDWLAFWQEAACMLCFIRDMHGQLWTTYEFSVELTDSHNALRYNTWKHFGRLIEPGAIVVESGYDAAAQISSVAFHHEEDETLSVVLMKMGAGTGTTAVVDANIITPGRWYLTDQTQAWADMGSITNGQSISMPGYSIATLNFGNYTPDISHATCPLQK